MSERLPRLKTLGERVEWARERKGMTQDELSKALGMDQTSISKWEVAGVKNPRKAHQLADILGVPVAWLIYGEENLGKLTAANVDALFELQNLPPEKQEMIRNLIKTLAGK